MSHEPPLKPHADRSPAGRALVIAGWCGERRIADPASAKDSGRYFKLWADSLRRYRHGIDLVVLAIPESRETRERILDFEAGIRSVTGAHQRVVVLRRANVGMSYGSWSDAFATRLDLDRLAGKPLERWYLFEDDWVPCIDHWDDSLVEIHDGYPAACFTGSVVRRDKRFPDHIGIGWGVANRSALETVWKAFGRLPHSPRGDYASCEVLGNVALYVELCRATGLALRDVESRYRSAYLLPSGEIHWYYARNPHAIVMPAQVVPGATLSPEVVGMAEQRGVLMDLPGAPLSTVLR